MTRPIRNFLEMMGLLSRGRFAERLDQELQDAIQTLAALPSEKGTASINLTITLSYQGGRLDIKPNVKTKLPEGAAFTDTPFWTYDGGLSVQHPSQMDLLAPRAVPAEATAADAKTA